MQAIVEMYILYLNMVFFAVLPQFSEHIKWHYATKLSKLRQLRFENENHRQV